MPGEATVERRLRGVDEERQQSREGDGETKGNQGTAWKSGHTHPAVVLLEPGATLALDVRKVVARAQGGPRVYHDPHQGELCRGGGGHVRSQLQALGEGHLGANLPRTRTRELEALQVEDKDVRRSADL